MFSLSFRLSSSPPAFFPDGFRLCFGTLDDKHEVIDIATISNGRFPLPVFFDSSTSASLDTVIPVPALLSGFSTQIALIQILYWSNSFSMMFDSNGEITQPCSTPSQVSRKRPTSTCTALMVFHCKLIKRASLLLRRSAFISSR